MRRVSNFPFQYSQPECGDRELRYRLVEFDDCRVQIHLKRGRSLSGTGMPLAALAAMARSVPASQRPSECCR